MDRRKFLKKSLLSGVSAITVTGDDKTVLSRYTLNSAEIKNENNSLNTTGDEILYNGIHLPESWPPKDMRFGSYDPMPVPYLESAPEVIPIDTGRQLFVDNFLIEHSDLERKFYQPLKYENNPILEPETKVELNKGICPTAAPFSDGCFYDPNDKLFKLWYMAGWFNGTALATSKDGINWTRPGLNIVPNTNLVMNPGDLRRDGASVWLDHDTKNPEERFKMYAYFRQGGIGDKLSPYGGILMSSHDGVHWKSGNLVTGVSDNNTFFYNPFRKKWVFTIRKEGRPIPPWSKPLKTGNGRARSYWENDSFFEAENKWDGSVFWFGADRLDAKRSNYDIGEEPQIYKVDAVGYESILLGLILIHFGPSNEICAKGGFPKLTELQLAFSRDGFHWDRSCRETFIGAHPERKESWERAYIHSVGGVCNIVNDKLYFYYSAFKGDETNRNSNTSWNGMYANASLGLAVLRRDGFASMETSKQGFLLTKPVKFSGKYFFINADASRGSIIVEICAKEGNPLPGFTAEDCVAVTSDSTKYHVKWKQKDNIEELDK